MASMTIAQLNISKSKFEANTVNKKGWSSLDGSCYSLTSKEVLLNVLSIVGDLVKITEIIIIDKGEELGNIHNHHKRKPSMLTCYI